MDVDEDNEFEFLLAPQRMATGGRVQFLKNMRRKKSVQAPLNIVLRKEPQFKEEAVSISDGDFPSNNKLDQKISAKSVDTGVNLQSLLCEGKISLLWSFLSTRSLVLVASINVAFRRYFLNLKCSVNVSFFDLSRIIRLGCGFGILSGCNLEVGSVEENVQLQDIEAVTNMLQNPKTQLNVTLVGVNSHFSRNIAETHIIEFLRSFRFPTLRSLTSLNLEGSLIGSKGILNFCSVIRGKFLPHLRELNLSRNAAKDTGINCLYQTMCTVECSPHLEILILASNGAGQSALDILCVLLRSRKSLTRLDISDNNINLLDGNASVVMKSNKPHLDSLNTLDLSFNPLEDEGMHTLFTCAWGLHWTQTAMIKSSSILPKKTLLKELYLVNCNLGNKTFEFLGHLLGKCHFSHLETLSLGINNAHGRDGIASLVDALCPVINNVETTNSMTVPVPSLKHFLVSMNNFESDGLMAILGAALQGAFSHVITLDVSDIGASPEAINMFINSFALNASCSCLRKLILFGRHPFAQRTLRSNAIPQSFLRRVKLS